jgi:hypothetical protein
MAVVLSVLSAPFEIIEGAEMDFVRWKILSQERTADAGMAIAFELVLPQGVSPDKADIVYASIPKRGAKELIKDGMTQYRKKIAADVSIYSGRTEMIDLRAKVSSGGRVYYAQAIVNFYGESGLPDPDAEPLGSLPDWPVFRLDGVENYYRAQTGTPVKVSFDGPVPHAGVFLDGVWAADVEPDGTGLYSYTAPHDEKLAKSGYSAKKDLVFVVSREHPGEPRITSSVCVPVYRAFYGQTSLPAGIAVLCASALAGFGGVILLGRRFEWR